MIDNNEQVLLSQLRALGVNDEIIRGLEQAIAARTITISAGGDVTDNVILIGLGNRVEINRGTDRYLVQQMIEGMLAAVTNSKQIERRDIYLQNQLDQLKDDWKTQREELMVAIGQGSKMVPGPGPAVLSIAVGLMLISFGLFWTISAASAVGRMPPNFGSPVDQFFPLFGLFFVLAGIGSVVVGPWIIFRARKYRKAEDEYKQKKAALIAKLDHDPAITNGRT